MTDEAPTYRWNTSAAAEAYDQAGPAIHRFYETVQTQILDRLPFALDGPLVVVDLGGESGRLAERLLHRFVHARVILIDQSEPFLALAERRLKSFASRTSFIQRRLQDNWTADVPASPNVIVSTSAIHHLAPAEKRALFAQCHAALSPGGMFINGDEYRPANDGDYRALLEKWSVHMYSALDDGRIPSSFRQTLDHWSDRNIRRFGEPKTSGDDCHETIATQLRYLHDAGFTQTETVWAAELWAVIVAGKTAAATKITTRHP
jgi:SAM-dependent methyltransferase